jgi:hypothetical protein
MGAPISLIFNGDHVFAVTHGKTGIYECFVADCNCGWRVSVIKESEHVTAYEILKPGQDRSYPMGFVDDEA